MVIEIVVMVMMILVIKYYILSDNDESEEIALKKHGKHANGNIFTGVGIPSEKK